MEDIVKSFNVTYNSEDAYEMVARINHICEKSYCIKFNGIILLFHK